jgi:hypothetical protein
MTYLFVMGLVSLAVIILSVRTLAVVAAALILKATGLFKHDKESEVEGEAPL